jgi:hypothetical protein
MAEPMGLKFVDLSKVMPEPAAIKLVPKHIAKQYNILPLKLDSMVKPHRLMVAIGDAKAGAFGLDHVRLVSRCKIVPVLAANPNIEEAISRAYSGISDT